MRLTSNPKQKKETILLALLFLITIIFQLATNQYFGFHRDELLYFSLGQHLDLGYHSVPPFIAFLAFIATKVFGYSLFAARFFSAIAGGVLLLTINAIVKELKGGAYAQLLAITSLVVSVLFVRASGLFQPVIFDILFWTIAIYILIKYINSENPKFLLLLGFVIGVGFLNKYNILFMVLSLFLAIIFTKYRKVFKDKYLYLGALIAFIIVFPNLVWQILHGFPVVKHLNELKESQLVHMNPFTFLVDQLLIVYPATLLTLPALFFLLFSRHVREYRVLGYYSLAVLFIFLILSGKSYYSAGIYPMLIAVGAVSIEKVFHNFYLRFAFTLLIVVLGCLNIPMGKPIYPPDKLVAYFDKMEEITGNDNVRRDEDNNYNKLPQDYTDMIGWNELTEITNNAWRMIDKKEYGIIYCENYGQAGAITIIGKKYNLPEPISFSDNFLYWIPRSLDHEKTDLIYINDELGDDVKQLFVETQLIGRISNPLSREFGTSVFLCRKPRVSFNSFWNERVKELDNN